MQLFATEHPFTSGVDISSTAFWTQTPLERAAAFAVLRREAPVSWHPPLEPSGRPQLTEAGFWAVTLAADIHYVSQHPELFSSALGGGPQVRRTEEVAGGTTVFNLDPPEHTRYRNMISAAFTPKGVARISSKIEERAERIVSAVVGAGEFDFVARVSS